MLIGFLEEKYMKKIRFTTSTKNAILLYVLGVVALFVFHRVLYFLFKWAVS